MKKTIALPILLLLTVSLVLCSCASNNGTTTTSQSKSIDSHKTTESSITITSSTVPTIVPTAVPTSAPTTAPTAVPTSAPTTAPTTVPTTVPTSAPTAVPTTAPTTVPTSAPTAVPTTMPTTVPTINQLSKFQQFEKGLTDSGIQFEIVQKAATMVGAKEGYGYVFSDETSVELYLFDVNTDAYKDAAKNNKLILADLGITFDVLFNDDICIYYNGVPTNKSDVEAVFDKIK